MKTLTIHSNKYGKFISKIDDNDFEKVKNLGGHWMINMQRGVRPYVFQWGIGRKYIGLHRFIMGEPVGLVVDHVNKDTLDNRQSNLRVCTTADNLRNGRIRVTNKSGYTGVCFINGKWQAYIYVKNVKKTLGNFKNIQDAVKARQKAEIQFWVV